MRSNAFPAARLTGFLSLLLVLALGGPASGQSVEELGRLYAQGRIDEVATGAQQALRSTPGDVELSLLAGQALVDLQRFSEAVPYLERVLAGDPGRTWRYGWASFHLGRAHFALDRPRAAADAIALAARLGSTTNLRRSTEQTRLLLGFDESFESWRVVESEHFRVHLPPNTRIDDPAAFARSREDALAELQRFFQAPLRKKIDLFVWRESADAERLGLRPLGFSDPALAVVHLREGQSRGHEITHVLVGQLTGRAGQSRLINEGVAVAFDLNPGDRMQDARKAVAAAGERSVSIRRLWDAGMDSPEELLYPVAGAFVERLISVGGRERFLRLLRDQTLQNASSIYGPLLDTTIAQFEQAVRGDSPR